VTEDEFSYLECYGSNTYAMFIPYNIAWTMEEKGWIEWVPPVFGTNYAITETGKRALADKRFSRANDV
jgi:hypothetical protein